jgi:hypothetical protein
MVKDLEGKNGAGRRGRAQTSPLGDQKRHFLKMAKRRTSTI